MADTPRINRCIELYESGEPLYYTGMSERLTYERGREMAATWADFILVEFEHHGLDTRGLVDFMQGLRDAGPTPTGHRTPTVLCTLPVNGLSEAAVHANDWQIRHILAAGVHGLVLCHARTPEAVRAFVEAVRYPNQPASASARAWARAPAAWADRASRPRSGDSNPWSTSAKPIHGR